MRQDDDRRTGSGRAECPISAADLGADPQLVEHPGDHRLAENLPGLRIGLQHGRQIAVELAERLLVEDHVVDVGALDASAFQAELDGLVREVEVVLDAREALFFGGGDQLAVPQQGRRGVVVVSRRFPGYSENNPPRYRRHSRFVSGHGFTGVPPESEKPDPARALSPLTGVLTGANRGLIGTTAVVPCYKAARLGDSFRFAACEVVPWYEPHRWPTATGASVRYRGPSASLRLAQDDRRLTSGCASPLRRKACRGERAWAM